MSFYKEYIKPIDMQLAARTQYDRTATVEYKNESIWGIKAKHEGQLKNINLQQAVDLQYSRSWNAYAVGVHKDDWMAFNLKKMDYVVVPIFFVAPSIVWDHELVKQKIENLKTQLIRAQEWTRQRVGKTFDVSLPIVTYKSYDKDQYDAWNTYKETPNHPQKFEYFYTLRDDVKELIGDDYDEQKHKYVVTVIGKDEHINWSCAISPVAVVSSRCRDQYLDACEELNYQMRGDEEDGVYVLLHELGHTFGLDHPIESMDKRNDALMYSGRPPKAFFYDYEIAYLNNSPFFK